MPEIVEQGYNEVTDVNNAPAGTLNATDLANIAALIEAALSSSPSAVIVQGGSTAAPAGCETDSYGNVLLQVGEMFALDIACLDLKGNPLPITGWTAVGNVTAADGSAVTSNVSCAIAYGRGGVVTYPIQATDTENSGTYTLTITLTSGSQLHRVVSTLYVSSD